MGVSVPSLVDSAINLIGQTTSGIALFVAALSVAAYKMTLNLEVGVNAVCKMMVQPALFLLLAPALSIKEPYGHEGFLLTVLPAASPTWLTAFDASPVLSGDPVAGPAMLVVVMK